MKKVILVFMFLILAGSVLAMSEPITVKTAPGDWVKVYAWPVPVGKLLNLDDGIADKHGYFNTTFFSLNVPDVKFTIFIIRNDEKIKEADFLNHDISKPLNVDCTGINCISIDSFGEDEVVETVIEETVVGGNNVSLNDSELVAFTGLAMFNNKDGSLGWGYYVGGLIVVVIIFVLVFWIIRSKNKFRKLDSSAKVEISEEDRELDETERKVKETEAKIAKIKNEREKKKRIYEARAKLAREEAELRELETGGTASPKDIQQQRVVVQQQQKIVQDHQQQQQQQKAVGQVLNNLIESSKIQNRADNNPL